MGLDAWHQLMVPRGPLTRCCGVGCSPAPGAAAATVLRLLPAGVASGGGGAAVQPVLATWRCQGAHGDTPEAVISIVFV